MTFDVGRLPVMWELGATPPWLVQKDSERLVSRMGSQTMQLLPFRGCYKTLATRIPLPLPDELSHVLPPPFWPWEAWPASCDLAWFDTE